MCLLNRARGDMSETKLKTIITKIITQTNVNRFDIVTHSKLLIDYSNNSLPVVCIVEEECRVVPIERQIKR